VVGRRTANDTASLIEEVARGERLLEEIKDRKLRETVRLALRLHHDPYSGPDAPTRSRIRSRVLRTLRPHPATLGDRFALLFEVLAMPTPYAMRAFGVALAFLCVVAGTTVASAGSVAADPLYSVKTASEQMRLALATTHEDRAVVWLSIAEHRLAEAAALAEIGNEDDAIIASGEYGEHMANAAAELAQVEYLDDATAVLVTQLQVRIEEHRATAAAAYARLADDPSTAPAAAVLALLATPVAPATDLSAAASIAAQAATAAEVVATAAERKVSRARLALVSGSQEHSRPASAEETPSTLLADADRGERAREGADRASKNERAAQSARKSADEAKAAAKKAKEGSRRTPATPRRR
jgi:hypothetical protein